MTHPYSINIYSLHLLCYYVEPSIILYADMAYPYSIWYVDSMSMYSLHLLYY